ncbi:MAG TPA: TPM domain-containing protein [Beijerinckiaceae bacterium]|jgi:putative membrane protein
MLSAEEQDRIALAIRDAETLTTGEIVVVVAGQASRYRTLPLLAALAGALATPWPLIALTALSASRIFLIQTLVALALALVTLHPSVRLKLAPRWLKRERGHEAARREFAARGLTRTRGRTGVLVYVAVAERYAEVLPDAGISERVDPGVWRATIEELVSALTRGEAADGLLRAVTRVGAILAEHAPATADEADELPNRVIVI